MAIDVYGIGNALVDIQMPISDQVLRKLASAKLPGGPADCRKGNMHLVDAGFQQETLKILERRERATVSGGSACNTLIGVAQLGRKAAYCGKVGRDAYGKFFGRDLRAASVGYDVPMGERGTGTCIVLVTPDAQRTMFTSLGISIELTPGDLDLDGIASSKWVYIEGYLWDAAGPKAASEKAMEHAKRHGAKVAYSYSDSFCVRRALDDFRRFTKEFVDLVFCNEDEARAFAGCQDTEAALREIATYDTGVALTCGKKGSILVLDGERHDIAPVPVKPVDTTGAGDLYAAGVLAGLCGGRPAKEAGELGSRMAARVIAVRGARIPASALKGETAGRPIPARGPRRRLARHR
ncbi:MAG: adenosine kinase [Elusimicrobia bacterium]|nr:adenosine kinase [Elusimicrobiota bacterium]